MGEREAETEREKEDTFIKFQTIIMLTKENKRMGNHSTATSFAFSSISTRI